MSRCSFSISFAGSGQLVADKARHAITASGGSFQGNDQSGSFRVSTPLGAIAGTYGILNQSIQVMITEKPFLIGCSLIEKQLRAYFHSFGESA